MPSSIPNLNLDTGAIIEFDRFWAKVYTDGEVVGVLESVVNKLKEKTRFAYAWFSHDNVLEDILVADGASAVISLHFLFGYLNSYFVEIK